LQLIDLLGHILVPSKVNKPNWCNRIAAWNSVWDSVFNWHMQEIPWNTPSHL